ncbi:sarcosine oxidase subunit gamma, partial [Bradyrhizobium sp.]|uniref:sarcosine oxidase subunit gamma n=1 Tax=Bradyrhizobium sp. TaxID=376 RepID=UPI003C5764FF
SPCRAIASGGRVAMWLGPDEWLLLAEDEEPAGLMAELEAVLGEEPHSLVDASHRQVGLMLEGRGASRLLSAGCPLDLHADAFPPGMVTRTLLAKADIVLWRCSAPAFRLEVWRSFADYVVALLAEAARGLPEY